LQEIRAHRGIDYAAATGTRVRATGDGIIELAGNKGGYGKVIMIRHTGDKTTVYGHLSGFAPNIRMGTRVSQGDIIGYVGATGLATGPHLHYEFRIAGVHRNPLSVILPPAAPLAQAAIPSFRAYTQQQLTRIANIRHAQMVMLD
jgi:murein DD-endopeptidase MepM/ murein hydrolase activator NlpD